MSPEDEEVTKYYGGSPRAGGDEPEPGDGAAGLFS